MHSDTSDMTNMMRRFFRSTTYDPSQPEAFALAFAADFWKREQSNPVELPTGRDLYNMSILTKRTGLSELTKRVALVSDSLILTHTSTDSPNTFTGSQYKIADDSNSRPQWRFDSKEPWRQPPVVSQQNVFLRSPDLAEMGRWLNDCRPLLERGSVFYYPDVCTYYDQYMPGDSWSMSNSITFDDQQFSEVTLPKFCNALVKNGKVAAATGADPVKSHAIGVTLDVSFPHLDGVTLSDYAKIVTDETTAFEAFQTFLRVKIVELEEALEADAYRRSLNKLRLEIEAGTRQLTGDLERLGKKRAFAAAGATVGAAGVVLLGVTPSELHTLLTAVGTSGGLWGLVNAQRDFTLEVSSLKQRPFYLVWLFQKQSNS